MSDDNTQDGAEPSSASAGSHGEPIGWQRTDEFGRPHGFLAWKDEETRWPKSQTVPLYLAPQPTLADDEQQAIADAIDVFAESAIHIDNEADRRRAETLRGLLRRLS